MKKILICFFSLIPFIISCQEKIDFNGPWTSQEAYDYWKSGKSEEIVATESKIGNTVFLMLTNSIVIRSQENPALFSVPGGRWYLRNIKPETAMKYQIELESIKTKGAFANLYINIAPDSSIFFEVKSMSKEFKFEFDQAFLMIGEKFPYILCDKKK